MPNIFIGLRSYAIGQVCSRRSRGGARAPLFLDQTEARRPEEKILETGPPFVRVCMTAPLPTLSSSLDPALVCNQHSCMGQWKTHDTVGVKEARLTWIKRSIWLSVVNANITFSYRGFEVGCDAYLSTRTSRISPVVRTTTTATILRRTLREQWISY